VESWCRNGCRSAILLSARGNLDQVLNLRSAAPIDIRVSASDTEESLRNSRPPRLAAQLSHIQGWSFQRVQVPDAPRSMLMAFVRANRWA